MVCESGSKAHIGDEELCAAISQVMEGQADDLGGGVYKKRLRKNQYRSIIFARAGSFGFTSIYSPSNIGRTLTTMSWSNFAS